MGETKRREARGDLASLIAKAALDGFLRAGGLSLPRAVRKPPVKAKHRPRAKALTRDEMAASLHRAATRNATEGQLRRDEAIDRVEAHADPAWLRQAYALVKQVASKRAFFTTSDVWEAGLPMTREPRALGSVMCTAQRDGLIEATASYRHTARPSRHHAPVLVWRSLLVPIAAPGNTNAAAS